MNENNNLYRDALNMLKVTSRTFFIPISQLSEGLQEAVASAYLCMRAIDEIEDHPELDSELKVNLLNSVSVLLQTPFDHEDLTDLFDPYKSLLPEVTLRFADWLTVCPPTIVQNVMDATSAMAAGMAEWVVRDWQIKDEKDLDRYTFHVAGLVGVMLSDIWEWYDDSIQTDRDLAIAFGRGLQSVNILRNRVEDMERGADFFPDGWQLEDMFMYARRNLALADNYIKDIKPGPIFNFCKIPLMLAYGTLDALMEGKEKMTREEVLKLVSELIGNTCIETFAQKKASQ